MAHGLGVLVFDSFDEGIPCKHNGGWDSSVADALEAVGTLGDARSHARNVQGFG